MQNVYVITESHFSDDAYDDAIDTEVIICFSSKEQAEKFIESNEESEYPKVYHITSTVLI